MQVQMPPAPNQIVRCSDADPILSEHLQLRCRYGPDKSELSVSITVPGHENDMGWNNLL
jgi:hypothetical protein